MHTAEQKWSQQAIAPIKHPQRSWQTGKGHSAYVISMTSTYVISKSLTLHRRSCPARLASTAGQQLHLLQRLFLMRKGQGQGQDQDRHLHLYSHLMWKGQHLYLYLT
jgi:hypothetical protein